MLLTLFVVTPEPALTFEGLLRFGLVLGLALGTVLVFSAGSYAVIEMPARAWLRRSLNGPARGRVLVAGGSLMAAVLLFCASALPNLTFPHRGARLADLAALKVALSTIARREAAIRGPQASWGRIGRAQRQRPGSRGWLQSSWRAFRSTRARRPSPQRNMCILRMARTIS